MPHTEPHHIGSGLNHHGWQDQLHHGTIGRPDHQPFLPQKPPNTYPTLTLTTSHEDRGSTLRQPGSHGLDIQNLSVLWLSRDPRPRETNSFLLLHGGSGSLLIPMDVEEWVPHIMARHASSTRIALRPFILWWPSGHVVQINSVRLHQRVPHWVWMTRELDHGPCPSFPP